MPPEKDDRVTEAGPHRRDAEITEKNRREPLKTLTQRTRRDAEGAEKNKKKYEGFNPRKSAQRSSAFICGLFLSFAAWRFCTMTVRDEGGGADAFV
jgi:hypothetical protein